MPTTQRRIHPDLIAHLRDEPYRFEFFQAVRLLLAKHRTEDGSQEQDVLGQAIQFRNSVSLAFPASEIESIEFEPGSDDAGDRDDIGTAVGRVTMTPSFIGLTGPLGVMPRHYTQHVAERETYHRDRATRSFLDIFTSRAVALFYQSWLKYRLHLQYETDRSRHFLPLILHLGGLDVRTGPESRVRDDIADETLAYYMGPLRQRPQSVQWFSRVIAEHFEVSCHAEQFVGQWMALPPAELTCLGVSHSVLGTDTFCGDRYWNRQSRVRLTLGPLRQSRFDDFLPEGAAGKKIARLFLLMVGVGFDCEIRLKLDRRDVGAVRLQGGAEQARLGFSSWLASRPIAHDVADTTYLLHSENRN